MRLVGALLLLCGAASAGDWPDLSAPARRVGGGEDDAAVIAGVERYFAVPAVAGAEANAKAWYDYFTKTRGVPIQNVKLLLGEDATREEMLDAARKAAGAAGTEGTLWFVFIGHGAPSSDGKDGLLVGVDAQQKAESLQHRSLKRQELVKALQDSRAGGIRVILDACFSGRQESGEAIAPGLMPLRIVSLGVPLDPRTVILTAAKGNQFAGALPGEQRPAFSYLVLGGLRGWAASAKASVTSGDLWRYATNALEATLHGRNQTPELTGGANAVMGESAGEKGPDLAELAKAAAGGGSAGGLFHISSLGAVPTAEPPSALAKGAAGLDLSKVDVAALEEYDAVVKFDKGDAPPEEKAQSWRRLAQNNPKFGVNAAARADLWDRYALQKKAADEARQKRLDARDADWGKLSRLLALSSEAVPDEDKNKWAGEFAAAYMKSPGIEPAMAKGLAPRLPAGPRRDSLAALALQAPKEEPSPIKRFEGRYSSASGSILKLKVKDKAVTMSFVQPSPKAQGWGWSPGDVATSGILEGETLTGTTVDRYSTAEEADVVRCYGARLERPTQRLTLEGSVLKLIYAGWNFDRATCAKTGDTVIVDAYTRTSDLERGD